MPTESSPRENRFQALEDALVDDFLRAHGYSHESLRDLPKNAARRILADAQSAAAQRLVEIECRAHWLGCLHPK